MSARTERETVTEGEGGRQREGGLKTMLDFAFSNMRAKPTQFSYAVDDVT